MRRWSSENSLSTSGSPAFLPARRVPLLYLGFAHACLAAALAILALRPGEMGGFYYHPQLIALVHLVTLGFITSSILGALYLVCPLAFRLPLPEGPVDLIASACWIVAVSGVAAHFWLERYVGLAWAGAMALLAPLWVGGRVLLGLRRSPVRIEARLPIGLAILNLYATGGLGVILALNKGDAFIPFSQLDMVHAHLHLGAVGFATLMVVGAGYRMLPMVLPAAMPGGRLALASGLVIQGGILGLAAALLFAKSLVPAFASVVLAGVGLFGSRVVFMLRNRRPAPAERPRPDWPLVHVLQALAYLALTGVLGLGLTLKPPSEGSLRLAFAYGVCGLVGFLCQLIIGVEARLLPMAAWLQAFAGGGYATLPASLHTAMPAPAAASTVVLWSFGVPCLAAGLTFDRRLWVSVGAWALALSVLVVASSVIRALRVLRPPPGHVTA